MEPLITSTTRHQVYLERLKAGEIKKVEDFLLRAEKSVRERLSSYDLTEISRRRLERLLDAIERDLRAIYGDYQSALFGTLDELAEYEAQFEARNLANAIDDFEAVIPSIDQILSAVREDPLSIRTAQGGSLLEPFIREWTELQTTRVSGAIRQGFFEGEGTAAIIRRIRGSAANNYKDGILAMTQRSAGILVRTSLQHVATSARRRTWEMNSDIVKRYQWVSTLDHRTSQICRSLDGQIWEVGKGPLPPIHLSCRSTVVPVLSSKLSEKLAKGRTRASKDGYVPGDLTYYAWLKKQPAAFQDQAIGPTRAKLLRDGGLSAERFSELNLNRNFEPMTLADMRELEPLAFDRAGL